jgi:hypothetical protein
MVTLSTRDSAHNPTPKRPPKILRGGPRRGALTSRERPVPSPDVRRAVYSGHSGNSGQDRLGSYRRVGAAFEAFDRLGRALGVFSTEREAIASIDGESTP